MVWLVWLISARTAHRRFGVISDEVSRGCFRPPPPHVRDDQQTGSQDRHARRTHASRDPRRPARSAEPQASGRNPRGRRGDGGKVSAPTFYTYFKSVEEGLLILCEEAGEDFQRLAKHIHADWTGDRAFEAVRAYVLEVLALWNDHGPVLRVEHMLADKGEPEFAESRIRRQRRLHPALERRIARPRRTAITPRA